MKMNYFLPTIFGVGLLGLGIATLVHAVGNKDITLFSPAILKGAALSAVGGIFLVLIVVGLIRGRRN